MFDRTPYDLMTDDWFVLFFIDEYDELMFYNSENGFDGVVDKLEEKF